MQCLHGCPHSLYSYSYSIVSIGDMQRMGINGCFSEYMHIVPRTVWCSTIKGAFLGPLATFHFIAQAIAIYVNDLYHLTSGFHPI